MLWNKDYSSHFRRFYTSVIASMIPGIRDEVRGRIIREGTCSSTVSFDVGSGGEVPAVMREACGSVAVMGGQQIAVNGCFDRLIFTHTALRCEAVIASVPPKKIGCYTVCYADGTEAEVPVGYGGNISVWTRRYGDPMPQQYYRHQGYSATWLADPVESWADGRAVTFYAFPWDNPYPGKEIASILCTAEPDAAEVVMADISGEKFDS